MIYRILTIVLIIAASIGYSVYQKKTLESNLASDTQIESVLGRMPSTTFETLDGQASNLEELYTNESPQLVVVHFWGTWCAPCEAELPELMTLIKKYEGHPKVFFLLVAVNDEVMKVQKFLKGKGLAGTASLHWLMDNKNNYRDIFGTTRVPETFVFSSDKTALRKFIGPQSWTKPSFLQTFEDLLQVSSNKL